MVFEFTVLLEFCLCVQYAYAIQSAIQLFVCGFMHGLAFKQQRVRNIYFCMECGREITNRPPRPNMFGVILDNDLIKIVYTKGGTRRSFEEVF